MPYRADEELFPIWREPRSVWERTGLSRTQQRILEVSLVLLVLVFTAGWIYAVIQTLERGDTPRFASRILAPPAPLSRAAPPEATFSMNALMERLIDWDEIRGVSGEIRIVVQDVGDTLVLPGEIPEEVAITYAPAAGDSPSDASGATPQPARPGLWNLLLGVRSAVRQVPELRVATLTPAAAVRDGQIGAYRIGRWPAGEGAYAPPRGFIEVTQENMNTYVSTHFQLKDFLTKGQEGVWPKYVALSTRLLDKLELTLQELERNGYQVENVFVVSGFRTPWYNATGGNVQGRGALSRHMYGDAADIAIDNDRSGCMDDLNGDGRVDVQDARIVANAAEAVERAHPHLIGGIGIYRPERGSHCGMVHIDTRGNRARW